MLLRMKMICSYDHGVAVTGVDFSLEEEARVGICMAMSLPTWLEVNLHLGLSKLGPLLSPSGFGWA